VLYTQYTEDIHSAENGAEWYRASRTDGFKAPYRDLSQRFTVTETRMQRTVQSEFVYSLKRDRVRGREA